jgi:murein DD-endopeptidase MepM/ murein hydrolase activator NlpD
VIVGIAIIFLFVEYKFFKEQATKMIELQEEYRSYIVAIKKVLQDYNSLKEKGNGGSGDSSTSDAQEYSYLAWQAAQAECEEVQTDTKDSFLLVNRESSYLKKSMIDYMRTQKLDHMINQVDLNEWQDYHEQLLSGYKPAIQKNKTMRSTRRITTKKNRTTYMAPLTSYKDINLSWPIERSKFWLSCFFGPRKKPRGFHTGIDLAAMQHTDITAATRGVVVRAGFYPGYGNLVDISHNAKYRTRYAHLHKIKVKVGDTVNENTIIGTVGSTGRVVKKGKDASHLHFEVHAYGKQINPMYFFA